MAGLPILLIQLRRLGDLILTFPLISTLKTRYPGSPLLFVGEERFYKELQPLVPGVQFLPPSNLPSLSQNNFELLINLDSRPEAAACAAKANAHLKIGPVLTNAGTHHVEGFWQLYRSSLTGNNHHNLFHWGDLNRLDLSWPLLDSIPPRNEKSANSRIGLFIGASELAKRPDSAFWLGLTRLLLARGLKPVLLGGPSEKEEGENIAAKAGMTNANFCGKTNLIQLSSLLQSLDLLITPDTGPMHLADWLGTPVLNLSMGNVQAWETGPMRSGQLVMRANMSCVGCWQCSRSKLYCRNVFSPTLVAKAAQAYFDQDLNNLNLPGRQLLISGRDEYGLYKLASLESNKSIKMALDQFWQAAFLFFNKKIPREDVKRKAETIIESAPNLAENIRKNISKLLSSLLLAVKGRPPSNIWKNFPRHLNLFAGFMEMSLQNESFSRPALSQALELTKQIEEFFTP